MPNTLVSLDVETTGPAPSVGELATIGAVAIDEDTLEPVADPFYARLLPAAYKSGDQYHEILGRWRWEPDTFDWWQAQDPAVRREALGPVGEPLGGFESPRRVPARHTMVALAEWAAGLPGVPVLVAHPACFDAAFINAYAWQHLGRNPFGYRALCIRSFGYAVQGARDWGADRTDDPEFHVPSAVPHHALHDAIAQAAQITALIRHARTAAG